MTFADVIYPLTPEEFCRKYFGNEYVRLDGPFGRFTDLISWAALNEVLSNHRLGGRMSLVRNGTRIAPAEYLKFPAHPVGSAVNRRTVERRLRLGDTLVLNAVEELFPAVQTLVDSIEDVLRLPIGANLYAGFRHWKGFDLHWDEHDTLILQIHGTKHWQVYEPTKPNPVSRSRPQDTLSPTAPPVWNGILNAGEVLYMPRGWWHVAEPMEGPSLHVTFSIPQPTGLDLLAWLIDDLKDVDGARMNISAVKGEQSRQRFAESLTSIVTDRLNGDTVKRFLWAIEAKTGHGPPVMLPDAAREQSVEGATPLILVDARRLMAERLSSTQVGFWAVGRFWRCDTTLWPALECLNAQTGHSLNELMTKVPQSSQPTFQVFLASLIAGGVVTPAVEATPRGSVDVATLQAH